MATDDRRLARRPSSPSSSRSIAGLEDQRRHLCSCSSTNETSPASTAPCSCTWAKPAAGPTRTQAPNGDAQPHLICPWPPRPSPLRPSPVLLLFPCSGVPHTGTPRRVCREATAREEVSEKGRRGCRQGACTSPSSPVIGS